LPLFRDRSLFFLSALFLSISLPFPVSRLLLLLLSALLRTMTATFPSVILRSTTGAVLFVPPLQHSLSLGFFRFTAHKRDWSIAETPEIFYICGVMRPFSQLFSLHRSLPVILLAACCLLMGAVTGCREGQGWLHRRTAADEALRTGVTPALALPLDQMQEGDLVFRCGEGIVSRAVTSVEKDGLFSHVGILVRDGGEWKVVHAVPGEKEHPGDFDRVKAETPERFFAPARARVGAMVHCGLSDPAVLERLRETALGWARDSVRFDDDYDLADSSRLYCTELVWRLYRLAGIDLSEGRRRNLNILFVHGECLLPEHLFHYSGKSVYYQFNTQSL
jgi:hypothetical protein